MAQVIATTVRTGVHELDPKSHVTTEVREEFPWSYLDADFYPDTPPVSVSDGHGELTRSSSPVQIDDEPVVAVLGVGYVGTHLVSSFASRYNVIGFDVSHARIHQLRGEFQDSSTTEFTDDPRDLARATHFLISVPTLLRPDRTIDSSYLREAIKTVGQVARRGSTVVVESSVAVGMTRQLLGPLAKSSGFFAGMSPEVRDDKSSASLFESRILIQSSRELILVDLNHQYTPSRKSYPGWMMLCQDLLTP
jgi:hypothetical protein